LAQIAFEILGIDTAKVRVVHGDTALTPYSTGTWGSRSMVMAGGAVARACIELGERAKMIGAKLLQLDPAMVSLRDGLVCGPNSSINLSEVAHTWYRRPQDCRRMSIPAGWKRPPATSRSATAAPSPMLRMPSPSPSIPTSARSSCSD